MHEIQYAHWFLIFLPYKEAILFFKDKELAISPMQLLITILTVHRKRYHFIKRLALLEVRFAEIYENIFLKRKNDKAIILHIRYLLSIKS